MNEANVTLLLLNWIEFVSVVQPGLCIFACRIVFARR